MSEDRNWEQMGAASGLFAVLLFVVAFIIFLNTDPSGGNTPAAPEHRATRRPPRPSSPTTSTGSGPR